MINPSEHNFLIQIDENTRSTLKEDFVFHLEKAIDFHKWFNNDIPKYGTLYSDDVKIITKPYHVIPVGTVEFVSNYYNYHFGFRPKPWNVPETLFCYANRKIANNKLLQGKAYLKSNDIIKHSGNGINTIFEKSFKPEGNYQCSEYVEDVESEWRGVVYDGELLDLRCYSGDFRSFPSIERVENMIRDFKDAPIAYTIDVATSTTRGTFLMEVHDFFSCGLYGFEQYYIYTVMLCRTHYELIKKYEN